MFFEDEKENLENLDNLDDLDLDLSDDGDDESISWDELLKDEPVDVSDDVLPLTSAKKDDVTVKKADVKKPAADKKHADEAVLNTANQATKGAKNAAPRQSVEAKQSAFEVFGGEKQSAKNAQVKRPDDKIDEQDDLEILDDIDDSEDDVKSIGIKADDKRHNIPVLAGILFALVLVVGSVLYLFISPKTTAPVANVNTVQQAAMQMQDTNTTAQESPDTRSEVKVAGEGEEAIPVIDDKSAKDLKAEKKVVLSVESAGRVNPFLPTFDDFNGSYYAGLPAQVLAPPDQYGDDQDAQELLEVSVSGILFDSVKPSAIVTINSMDYFVQKGDTIDDYLILDINRQNVVIKKGTNIYKAGVGERFNQNMQISGAATYSANGTRHYVSASDEYTSASDVEVRAVGRR